MYRTVNKMVPFSLFVKSVMILLSKWKKSNYLSIYTI